jgi:hypothetical protein
LEDRGTNAIGLHELGRNQASTGWRVVVLQIKSQSRDWLQVKQQKDNYTEIKIPSICGEQLGIWILAQN